MGPNIVRLRDDNKLATTTYVNELNKALRYAQPPQPITPPPTEANEVWIVSPTDYLAGGGRYMCNAMMRRILNTEELPLEGEQVKVGDYPVYFEGGMLANLAEANRDTHLLPLNRPVLAFFCGHSVGGLPVFTTYTDPPGPFSVKVTNDGGSQGNATTAATWTYTVKDLAGNELGTGVSLYRARSIGITNYASADSYGLATHDAEGNLILLEVFKEYRGTTQCEEE